MKLLGETQVRVARSEVDEDFAWVTFKKFPLADAKKLKRQIIAWLSADLDDGVEEVIGLLDPQDLRSRERSFAMRDARPVSDYVWRLEPSRWAEVFRSDFASGVWIACGPSGHPLEVSSATPDDLVMEDMQ